MVEFGNLRSTVRTMLINSNLLNQYAYEYLFYKKTGYRKHLAQRMLDIARTLESEAEFLLGQAEFERRTSERIPFWEGD